MTHMPSRAAGHSPVIFLNPNVILSGFAGYRVGQVAAPVTGGALSFRRESVEAMQLLCGALGAVIVCTAATTPFDPRDQLLGDGLACPFALDWHTDWTFPDRASAITRWHDAHGRPTAVVVDRPGAGPDSMVRIGVPEARLLTLLAARDALALLDSAAGSAARSG